jgi:Flp pilus assembly protein CpaB
LIPENMRAAAVRVDDVVGVAGFIHPDDHVDVIVTMHPEKGGETTSRVILQNVRVLAVGQELGVDEQKRNMAQPVTVATLLVSTEESEMLALASAQGRLLLTLRPWADRTQIFTNGVAPTQLLGALKPHTEPEPRKKNEAVLSTKLASREAGSGLASLLPENMRAAAVRVDDVVGVAGFIQPDDHVDVIVTMRLERGGETTSRVILQNVRVLAVGQQLGVDEQKRNQAMPVTVATLLVSTEESEMLALASAQGRLLLTLRPWADKNQIATLGVGPTQLMGPARPRVSDAPARPQTEERLLARVESPVRTAVAPASPQPAVPETVEILRGDRFEQRKFEGKSPPRSGE